MESLKAIASGLLVGIVVIEGLTAGLAVLLPSGLLVLESGQFFIPAWPLHLIPALIWLLGSTVAGAMASAMRAHPGAGLICGLLLAIALFVLTNLVEPGAGSALLAAALPISGAAAGSALARRLDRAVSSGSQTV